MKILAIALFLPLAVSAQTEISGVIAVKKSAFSGLLARQRLAVSYADSPAKRLARTEVVQNALSEVVVYLIDNNPDDGLFLGVSHSKPDAKAEMRQRDKAFIPHVLPVTLGTAVIFPNDDPIFHNVFSLSHVGKFDLGKYSRESPPRGYAFEKPGVVPVFCDIHRHMKAYVLTIEHPYFVQASSDGRFTLSGLPEGDWRVAVWHPVLAADPQRATPGQPLSFSLVLRR